MIEREIVRTCSNPHVARAAVESIGGDFARKFCKDAASRNLTSGVLASRLVHEFARYAGDGDWEALDEAIRGADMPILSGLRYILDRDVKLKSDDAANCTTPPSVLWRHGARSCA